MLEQTQALAPVDGSEWFVIHCHAGKERTAERHLRRQQFGVFLPLLRRQERRAGREVVVSRPLFPNYLFATFDRRSQPWRCINGTLGVRRLISFTDIPEPVDCRIMDPLLNACDDEGVFSFRRIHYFQNGDRVRLAKGPLAEMIGTIEEMNGTDRARLLLDLLGRPTRVTVALDDLQAVA